MKPLLVLGALLLGACGSKSPTAVEYRAGDVRITRPFAFAPITQSEAAGYITLVVRGDTPDTLLSVSSTDADAVSLHRQQVSGASATMEPVASLLLHPGTTTSLEPGGLHLMFSSLKRLPQPGDTLHLTLQFARGGTATVPLPVRAYADGVPD